MYWRKSQSEAKKDKKKRPSCCHSVSKRIRIDDGTYIWVLQRELHLRHDKPLLVTVNMPVKFIIDKHDAYLLDDDGKEHKLSLFSKTLKTAP